VTFANVMVHLLSQNELRTCYAPNELRVFADVYQHGKLITFKCFKEVISLWGILYTGVVMILVYSIWWKRKQETQHYPYIHKNMAWSPCLWKLVHFFTTYTYFVLNIPEYIINVYSAPKYRCTQNCSHDNTPSSIHDSRMLQYIIGCCLYFRSLQSTDKQE